MGHATLGAAAGTPHAKADVNVLAFGAKGDGTTDDTAALARAMRAAVRAHRRLFVPAGVYRINQLALPDGLVLRGAARSTTWLRGHVTFGSNQVLRDLMIGDAGAAAVWHKSGATNTVFERVRFRGGGGARGSRSAPVIFIGGSRSCRDVSFIDCEIECNLGTETPGDTNYGGTYNNITIMSLSALVTDITFDGCHVGVSNGRRSGSPRFGIECYTGNAGAPGFHNITLRDCVFEAADAETLDFSDLPASRSTGVLVEGCLIKGGGVIRQNWGNAVNFELPKGFVFRNNTVWRSYNTCFQMTRRSDSYSADASAVITGNTFDFAYDNGITPGTDYPISLRLDNNQFTDNTITLDYGSTLMRLRECHNTTVTGNTASIGGRIFAVETEGSEGNTIQGNTVDLND